MLKLILPILFFGFAPVTFAETVYFYLDQNGNPVYTDKQPASENYAVLQQKQLPPVSWQKAPKLTWNTPSQNKRKKAGASKAADKENNKREQCEQYLLSIKRLQNKLRQKQLPQKFDSHKKQLSSLRWQRRKNC